jgi:hypothetical protein
LRPVAKESYVKSLKEIETIFERLETKISTSILELARDVANEETAERF